MLMFTLLVLSCFTVRLVDGPTKYEGRVEVKYNGVWGTVCDDEWDLNDAQVLCTELGLAEAVAVGNNAFYGQGSGQIWLDDVNCTGTEETIVDCIHNGWGSHNCNHREDASVNCSAGMHVELIFIRSYLQKTTKYIVSMCNRNSLNSYF